MTDILHQAAKSRSVDTWRVLAIVTASIIFVVGIGDVPCRRGKQATRLQQHESQIIRDVVSPPT